MINPEEASLKLKGYFRKLLKILNEEAIFTLIRCRIYDKKRIDDMLCCIEGSFPQEYRDAIEKNGGSRLKSYSYYKRLQGSIKNKFLFSTSHYSVQTEEAIAQINAIISSINKDFQILYSEEPSIF